MRVGRLAGAPCTHALAAAGLRDASGCARRCVQVPVVDGFAFPHLTKRMNVAGRHITAHLIDLLSRRG